MDNSDNSGIMNNSEIAQQFEKSNLKAFLYRRTTFGNLNMVGKGFVESEMLVVLKNFDFSLSTVLVLTD